MVLPELDVGVNVRAVFVDKAERRSVGFYGHRRARGEVDAYADDILRVHTGLFEQLRDAAQYEQIIVGMLQRGRRYDVNVASDKLRRAFARVDDGVRIFDDQIAYDLAVLYIGKHRTSRKRSVIYTKRIFIM